MVSRSDRRNTEANRDGRAEVLAEHSSAGRDMEGNPRSGSWGTKAQGTQPREGEAGHHALAGQATTQTLSCTAVFRKLDEIAKRAVQDPQMVFTSLAHLLTPDFLAAAYYLDEWFLREVQPRLRGRSFLIRFADDFVIGCEREEDARAVMEQLRERFAANGLTIHPTKTRVVDFRPPVPAARAAEPGVAKPRPAARVEAGRFGSGEGTFDFLGFTHYWARSRRGYWVIKRRTAKKRLRRTLRRLWDWLRSARHEPVREQHQTLSAKLRGHYQYFGIRCNIASLQAVYQFARRAWRYWLGRRSQRSTIPWESFDRFLEQYVLPTPKIVHNI